MQAGLIDSGTAAPAFVLPDQSGTTRALADYAGAPLVLYFYPKDDTTACTEEACAFGELLPKFKGVQVVGISPDSVKSHAKFAAKYKLTFPLLADEPSAGGVPQVCTAFGVWQEKSMYGKKYMGVVRTTYLIGPDGTVAQRWDKVKVAGHAEEVLAAAKSIASGVAVSSVAKPAAQSGSGERSTAPKKATRRKAVVKSGSSKSAAPSRRVTKKKAARR
jgi:peroxiredoxin Q/BCP